jgi:hypothetical protein
MDTVPGILEKILRSITVDLASQEGREWSKYLKLSEVIHVQVLIVTETIQGRKALSLL